MKYGKLEFAHAGTLYRLFSKIQMFVGDTRQSDMWRCQICPAAVGVLPRWNLDQVKIKNQSFSWKCLCRTNVSVSTWRGSFWTFNSWIYSVSRGANWSGTAPCSGLQVCVSAGSDEVHLTRSGKKKKKNEGCSAFRFAFVNRFPWQFLLITWTDSCYILWSYVARPASWLAAAFGEVSTLTSDRVNIKRFLWFQQGLAVSSRPWMIVLFLCSLGKLNNIEL